MIEKETSLEEDVDEVVSKFTTGRWSGTAILTRMMRQSTVPFNGSVGSARAQDGERKEAYTTRLNLQHE
jgi:hypothetical protein